MAVVANAWGLIRRHGPNAALEVVVNFLGPLLIYDYVKPHLGDVKALIASSAPPILWSVVEFVRKRRVDAVSMLVLAGIALSLLAFIGGGDARFLQLREKLVTVTIGLVFLGSAAIGRPLIYYLARAGMQRRGSSELAEFESMRNNVYFRRSMAMMTVVWGVGLLADAAAGVALVLTLSIHDYLIAAPVLGYGTMGSLGFWTWWYARRQRAKGAARRAAEAAGASSTAETPF